MTDAAAIPARGLLLVANKGEHTLGIIDPDAGRQLATVEQSGVGSVSAVDLVARKVAVLDLEAWKVERLIDAGALADGLAWAAVKP